MPSLNRDTDSLMNVNVISAYRTIATSTIGHLTTAGHLPKLRPMALPDCEQVSHTGRVLTVTLTSGDTGVIRQALSGAMPQDVLCIDARVLGERACWGALRTCAAIYEQLSGVIVLGAITDSATLATLPMPVFAVDISAVTTSSHHADTASQMDQIAPVTVPAGKLREPIDYANVSIRTGDMAIMDADGIFIMDQQQAAQMLPLCQQKQVQDDHKLKLFLEAYHAQRLDELPL